MREGREGEGLSGEGEATREGREGDGERGAGTGGSAWERTAG